MVPLVDEARPVAGTAPQAHHVAVKNWAYPAKHFESLGHFLIHWVFVLRNPLCGFEMTADTPKRLLATYQEEVIYR